MNTQFTKAPEPKINAVFEIEGPVIASTIEAPIKRVDRQDDGSFTIVIDHWPTSEASQVVENIEDHMAYSCRCGSLNFALLKSGGIESNKCGEKLNDSKWSGSSKALEPMTDERIAQVADAVRWSNTYRIDFARAIEAAHGIGGTP